IAVGLRRLGHRTELMARLSRRPLAQVIRRHAEVNGIGLSRSVETTDPATLAFAALDEHGVAAYEFYVQGTADWGWTVEELSALPADSLAVHCGSLAAAISPGAEAILSTIQRVHAAGRSLVSFDPNVRPDLAGPRELAAARVERFVAAAHVVKASVEDVAWLYPDTGSVEVLTSWLRLGPALVVLTRGADGCLALTPHGVEVDAPAVEARVEDTIGAGDAFMAGLLSGLADGGCLSPVAVARMSPADLRVTLQRATTLAAMTCGRVGADPPTRAEYSAYVDGTAPREGMP
ncbi:MAG TPA: carbohydrate kinase, partial [Pseudonocardiaceae bacterium]|nr:carbohydrate kinase [Pseudonocardiaceae bacterium]